MQSNTTALDDAVRTLATHALPAFGLALVVLLLIASGVWWLLQRYAVHREGSRWPPVAYIAAHLAIGFAVICAGAAMFAEVAEELGDGAELGRLDTLFSDTVRSTVSRATLQAFALLTHFGDAGVQVGIGVTVAILLAVKRRYWLGAGWSLALLCQALLNHTLKAIFERTRPIHDHGLTTADGWSFPSGHASGSVVVYGLLAYVVLRLMPPSTAFAARLAVVLVAVAIAFTTGASRVFLQVHFASDVLAGFASGSAWLAVAVSAIELARYRSTRAGGPATR